MILMADSSGSSNLAIAIIGAVFTGLTLFMVRYMDQKTNKTNKEVNKTNERVTETDKKVNDEIQPRVAANTKLVEFFQKQFEISERERLDVMRSSNSMVEEALKSLRECEARSEGITREMYQFKKEVREEIAKKNATIRDLQGALHKMSPHLIKAPEDP